MQIDTVTKGKSLAPVLRANPGTTQMLPRNTGTSEDTTGTGERDLARLKGRIKESTTVAVAQDTADTGADGAD